MSEQDKSSLMLDFVEQHGGLERPVDGLGAKQCPRCGSGTIPGFGLMGGGVGPYVMCDGERDDATVGMECGWFYKEQERA